MLKNPVYIGTLVWGKITTKSFKSDKRVECPQEDRVVVSGAHEAIITKETFDKVQKMVSIKQPRNVTEFDNIFRGLLRCSDCDCNLAFQNIQGRHRDGSYCCNHARRYSRCTAHYIGFTPLYNLVMREVKIIADIAKAHETDLNEFVRALRDSHSEESCKKERRELDRTNRRISELDAIVKKLLEQNALGAVSDERFAALAGEYDTEQKTLTAQAEALNAKLRRQKDSASDISAFYTIVCKYTEVDKLTAPLLHELIDRIVVFDGEGRGNSRRQRVEVYFKLVGLLPDNLSDHCASR
jgi:hypothetical protein